MDLRSPPPFQQKHIHEENDGLQVASHYAPEAVPVEQPGLNVVRTSTSFEKIAVVEENARSLPPIEVTSPQRRSQRKRRMIIGGIVATIVIIIAAVVGGVLGTRHSSNSPNSDDSSNSDTSSTTPPTGPNSNLRIPSAKGAWNGTGMAICYAHHGGFWGFLFYQDHTGQVQAAQHTRPSDLDIGIRATYPVNVEAANGTALAAGRYNFNGTDTFHLIYVDRQNIVSDAWMPDSALDSQGNFNTKTPWTPGNLSALNFKVPTDNRVGMHMTINQQFYGKTYNAWGAKLVVGGADGALHQLAYDWPSRSWDPTPYKFEDSYAYGGVKIRTSDANAVANFNTTVYETAADGTLRYRVQSSTHPNGNDTLWPVGGIWQNPAAFPGTQKAAVNSSVAVSWDTDGVMFPNAGGKMGRVALDMHSTPQFAGYSDKYEGTTVMPGSEVTFDSLGGNQLSFYQPDGESIAFQVYDLGANLKKSGPIVS